MKINLFKYLAICFLSINLVGISVSPKSLAQAETEGTPKKKKTRIMSPVPSSVEGVSLPNVHKIGHRKGSIYRGMLPATATEVEELKKIGINKFLIFRNDNPGESGVTDELELLKSSSLPEKNIIYIPFKWKERSGFREPCLQTLNALRQMREVLQDEKSRLYFHCTAGEDRTGYLSGLYRMIFDRESMDLVFKKEMCDRGYAEGDPTKPDWVSKAVHENITTQFVLMAKLIQEGDLTESSMDDKICDRQMPENSALKKVTKGMHCMPFGKN